MSKIEWTEATWNPVVGCSSVSEGCRNCYAAKDALRLAGNPHPAVRNAYYCTSEMRGTGSNRRAVFTGVVRCLPERLEQPLRWRKPRRVFVNSMSDLFHEDVPFEFIDRVFAVMAITPEHTYQILTKRPEQMAEYMQWRSALYSDCRLEHRVWDHPVQEAIERIINTRPTPEDAGLWEWPLRNVWLGTSVEDQAAADQRIPHLLDTPAAVRFLSCEPLLAWVALDEWLLEQLPPPVDYKPRTDGIGWIIAGGESGPNARPCSVLWIQELVDQAHFADVPVFCKQTGLRDNGI